MKFVYIFGISVVVVIIILAILLGTVLCFGCGPGNPDPNREASILVKSLYHTSGEISTSREIVFSAKTDTYNYLHSRAIAQQADYLVQTNQICVFPGDFSNSTEFEVASEALGITYTDETKDVRAAITGICHHGDKLEASLDGYSGYENLLDGIQSGTCGCVGADKNGMCCVLSLVRR